MYYFRNRSLPITAPKCLCSGDVIFMLVLLNISAAFDLYSDLTINFVLPGFGIRTSGQHPKAPSTN